MSEIISSNEAVSTALTRSSSAGYPQRFPPWNEDGVVCKESLTQFLPAYGPGLTSPHVCSWDWTFNMHFCVSEVDVVSPFSVGRIVESGIGNRFPRDF